MVAADKIHIADIRKLLRKLAHCHEIVAVGYKIAGQRDDIRLFGADEAYDIVDKRRTVKIRQLHDLEARKALRQLSARDRVLRKLDMLIAVAQQKADQSAQHDDYRKGFGPFFHLQSSRSQISS